MQFRESESYKIQYGKKQFKKAGCATYSGDQYRRGVSLRKRANIKTSKFQKGIKS